jgi:ubiquitin-like modifier-activating enzyme ATG7
MSGPYNHFFCSFHAPAPPPGQDQQPQREDEGSVLGLVPHQLRGFLAQFRNMKIVGAAYDRCTGCSETVRMAVLTMSRMADLSWQVLRAYETEGFAVLLKAFNESGFLESLTGLDKLHAEGEQALEAVDWEEEEDGADDDF